MISKKAVWKGRTNDNKNEEEEETLKALDLYDDEGNLLSKKEKFRDLSRKYHGIGQSHKQKEKH